MIKIITKEYAEETLAIKTTEVYFLGIPIFKYRLQSTNNDIIKSLTAQPITNKIRGFTYEITD